MSPVSVSLPATSAKACPSVPDTDWRYRPAAEVARMPASALSVTARSAPSHARCVPPVASTPFSCARNDTDESGGAGGAHVAGPAGRARWQGAHREVAAAAARRQEHEHEGTSHGRRRCHDARAENDPQSSTICGRVRLRHAHRPHYRRYPPSCSRRWRRSPICRSARSAEELGVGLTITEFLSAHALADGDKKTSAR